ncbi:hypothetical protein [Angustibacter luteus]|uniref:Uncharacterized protein n=1 Tax=Angustibacter luteus TaxID=658456 RepID=A0ABW1JIA4_9ACTN
MTYGLNDSETNLGDGTTVTSGNSVGINSGTAFAPVVANSGTCKFSTTYAHRGSYSFRFDGSAGNSAVSRGDVSVSAAQLTSDQYVRTPTSPVTAGTNLFEMRVTSGLGCRLVRRTDNKLEFYDGGGILRWTSTGTTPSNAFWRFSVTCIPGASTSTGTIKCSYHTGANLESTTADESFAINGTANAGTGSITGYRRGKLNSTGTDIVWFDDDQFDDTMTSPLGAPVQGATVAAVAATATADAPIPTVQATVVISGGGPATASAQAIPPAITTGGAVTAMAATTAAAAAAPVITGGANVAALAATAAAQAIGPAVQAGSSANVTAVVATATAQAVPTILPTFVVAVVATSSAAAVPPVLSTGATAVAVRAVASSAAVPPGTLTGVAIPIFKATAIAQAPTGVDVAVGATVLMLPVSASAAAPTPVVAGSTQGPPPSSRTTTIEAVDRVYRVA